MRRGGHPSPREFSGETRCRLPMSQMWHPSWRAGSNDSQAGRTPSRSLSMRHLRVRHGRAPLAPLVGIWPGPAYALARSCSVELTGRKITPSAFRARDHPRSRPLCPRALKHPTGSITTFTCLSCCRRKKETFIDLGLQSGERPYRCHMKGSGRRRPRAPGSLPHRGRRIVLCQTATGASWLQSLYRNSPRRLHAYPTIPHELQHPAAALARLRRWVSNDAKAS